MVEQNALKGQPPQPKVEHTALTGQLPSYGGTNHKHIFTNNKTCSPS